MVAILVKDHRAVFGEKFNRLQVACDALPAVAETAVTLMCTPCAAAGKESNNEPQTLISIWTPFFSVLLVRYPLATHAALPMLRFPSRQCMPYYKRFL
jgi:hypothetical protein